MGQEPLPVLAFECSFEIQLMLGQELSQVWHHDCPLGEETEDGPADVDVEIVLDQCRCWIIWVCGKSVLVSKGAKRAFVLLIDEGRRAVELRDFGFQAANQAQVRTLEFDELALFDQSCGPTTHDSLASCPH